MDRNAMMEEAKDFSGPGSCYIHVEMNYGEREIMVSGNAVALVFAIGMICDSIAECTGKSPDTVLGAVKQLYYKKNRDEEDPGIYKEI